jgi:hypothetical protein
MDDMDYAGNLPLCPVVAEDLSESSYLESSVSPDTCHEDGYISDGRLYTVHACDEHHPNCWDLSLP